MMSYDAVPNFFADGNSDAVASEIIRQEIHYKVLVAIRFSLSVYFILPIYINLHRRKGHIYVTYADNTFLPFALLAARTFLPPAVAILALNP